MRSDLHEANRLSWNAATRAHNSHKADQAAFFRNGGSTLYPEELQLLGHLDGLRLLHLQCNAGQDSLSLARLGARVTGVDIADSAIDFARQLSRDSGIAADFQRDDILRWLPVAATRGERFERVFASYGTLVWLSDLKRWAVLQPFELQAGFDGMRDGGGGRMLPPADRPRLPLMYGLSARKPR